MYYPELVCKGHGEYTSEEIKKFDEFFIGILEKHFDNIEYYYQPHTDYPYTTDVLVYTGRWPATITGRSRKDKARFAAEQVTIRVYKETPSYLPDDQQLPDKYFAAQISVSGWTKPFRKKNSHGFTWYGYNPYKSGSELSDIDVSDVIQQIVDYVSDIF